jgi:hypothetical protein
LSSRSFIPSTCFIRSRRPTPLLDLLLDTFYPRLSLYFILLELNSTLIGPGEPCYSAGTNTVTGITSSKTGPDRKQSTNYVHNRPYGEGWGTPNQSLIAVKNPKRNKNRYAPCRHHGPPSICQLQGVYAVRYAPCAQISICLGYDPVPFSNERVQADPLPIATCAVSRITGGLPRVKRWRNGLIGIPSFHLVNRMTHKHPWSLRREIFTQ